MRFQIGTIERRQAEYPIYSDGGGLSGYERGSNRLDSQSNPFFVEIFHLRGYGETLKAAEKMAKGNKG